MNSRRGFLAGSASAIAALALRPWRALAGAARWPLPPQPPRIPTRVGRFGHARIDDYAWLRPKDWLAVLREPSSLDAPIRAAVEAENRYADAMLAPTQRLQDVLAARIAELEPLDQARLEVRAGDHFYSTRRAEGSEYAAHLRRPVSGGPEQVLLDPNLESAGGAYYALHWSEPVRSHDGRLFAWSEDRVGSGQYTIRVREIDSGRMVTEVASAYGTFALSPDGRWLFWVGRDAVGRAASIHRRDLASGRDALLYEEPDAGFFLLMRTTASGRYVVMRSYNGAQSEVRLVSMDAPESAPVLVEARAPGLNYDVDDWNGRLLVLTDADGAVDFKLMQADIAAPGKAHWQPLVKHQAGRLITAIHPFRDALVREEWRDAHHRLVLMRRDGGEREIAFDEPAYALRVPVAQAWDADALVFGYQSPRLPEAARRLSLGDGVVETSAHATVAAYDPARYEVRRLSARAGDGAEVPITVLMRKGAALDGSAPLLLYAYGSYGASVEARFQPSSIALVDQGWVYAIAHVRGGAEKGTHWWRSVLTRRKRTTFTDFIACAEHLVAQDYTAPRRIVVRGMSAGGLLAGAVYAMRPGLWGGVIAEVPFVDPLNTMEHFDSHPLGVGAIPIWGDPRIPEDHAAMQAWAPYEQLGPAAYPALLATGSVADERVGFYEPLKFAVKARALTTAARPIMVRIAMASGHAGDSGASAARAQEARLYAFASWAADDRWGTVPQRPGDD
ncbi:prolyl oligopeptidase family serine peptidase [Luteimonas saliphila]|uniref:prolyl oligopeptidase family serine peptidase n=1 Tax=Luteimonas saliphila TaxID=2804919 RepID=UPI00192D3F0E|nr:prolyl oligopeptidase family serine peptidase [Luteimonas saliphila]